MASARSIEAGRAYVRADADLSPLQKKLKLIESSFNNLGSRISGFGRGLAGVGAGATAIGTAILTPIAAATKAFASFGDQVNKTSIRTGLSAGQLTSLGFAAEQSGSSMEQLANALFRSNRRVANAATETGPAVRALKELGLNAKELSELDTETRFLKLADALGAVDNEFRRNQLGFEIFGDSFKQIQPLLAEGADGIRALQQEALDLGVTLDDADASNAAKLGDAFNRIGRSVQAAFIKIGAVVAEPALKALAVITKIASAVAVWVDNNRGIVRTVAAIGVGIAAAGAVATALGATMIGVGAAIASIGTIASAAFGAVSTAIAVVTSPITLIVAGIAGIGYAVLSATGGLSKLAEAFGSLGETATTAWGGIVAAVSTGDLQTAGEIAFTALEVAWLTLTTKIKDVWSGVADFFRNVWLNAVESIVQIGAQIYFGVSKQFDALAVTLQGAFDTAAVYILGAIESIGGAIAKATIKAQEFFGLFSAEQSARIQGNLDRTLASRAGQRQAGLSDRAASRQAGLDQRDAARRQTAQDFANIVSDDFERRRSRSSADRSGLTAAQKRLEELQIRLQEQSSAASERAVTAQEESTAVQKAAVAQGAASSAAITSTSAGSVGTFVSGIAANILGGGVQDQVKDAQLDTAANTGKMVDKLDQLIQDGALQ